MKNKVYSSKFAAIFYLISMSLFIVIELINVYLLINNIIYKNDILIEIIMTIGFLPFIILSGLVANRFGYLVIYDSVNNTLSRRGYVNPSSKYRKSIRLEFGWCQCFAMGIN